jgi:capsular polysaccharide biosynthesis protein
MELRAYGQLLKRRWIWIVIPAAVALVLALVTYSPSGPLYNAGVRFIVGQEPTKAADLSDEERLANWKASEYVVNTLADWVKGGQFATLVSDELAAQGVTVAPQSIVGSTVSDSTRSMMVLSMTYHDAAILEQMLNKAAAVLKEQNDLGLPQLGGIPAELVQLDEPIVNQVPASITKQLELPLRILLAIGAGIGLAFLVDYLDPTVRERKELESMGIRVIAEIPKK